ncbi:MAG: HEAT repeat domain-containing protein [Candidatus Brocadiaceae bacterium]|nr:HEAT repeat domain-containing protein [Candidatus Brocadiaceae bacterium]
MSVLRTKGIFPTVAFLFLKCLIFTVLGSEVYPASTPETLDKPIPKILASERVIDFGEIYEGEEVTTRFHFQNVGDGDLKVGTIWAEPVLAFYGFPESLTTSVPKTVIAPCKEGEIVANFKSEGFNGLIERNIDLYTNDLSQPRINYQLRGKVQSVLTAMPRQLFVGVLYKSEYPWIIPTVIITHQPGIDVTCIKSTSPYIKAIPATMQSVSPSAKEIRTELTIEIDPNIPADHLQAHLIIFTNHPKQPKMIIPVTGDVREDRVIVANPSFLDFGLLGPEEEQTRKVLLSRDNRQDWKPIRAEAEAKGTTVQVSFQPVGPNWEVSLRVRPTVRLEDFRGLVHVVTDNKKQPKVTIPLLGWTYDDDRSKVSAECLKEFVADILDEEYLQDATVVLKPLRGEKEDRAFAILASILREGESIHRVGGDSGLADLGKGKWRARLRAVEVLAELDHPDVAERLDAAARNDPDGIVRMEALRALFTLSPMQARKTLIHSLRDEAPWIRILAADLLGQAADRGAIPALLHAMMDDEQKEVRLTAAQALEKTVIGPAASDQSP